MSRPFILSLFTFLIVFSLYWFLSKSQSKRDLKTRLKFSEKKSLKNNTKTENMDKEKEPSFIDDLIKKIKNKNKQTVDDFRIRFEQCGWDPHSAAFLVPIYKICSVIVFIILFFFLNEFSGAFSAQALFYKYLIFFLFIGIGFRFFDYFTDFRIASRRNIILKDIPMAIDLLVVCARAGLPFDRSLDRISQEIIHTNPDLARELTITSAELSILPDRKIAYQNLARRVDSDLIKNLTTSLAQAEGQGVPIGKTLMYLSQESSKQKLMTIEAKAAKLPSKLTVPVVLLSLPAILIIILGPTIAAILDSDMFK